MKLSREQSVDTEILYEVIIFGVLSHENIFESQPRLYYDDPATEIGFSSQYRIFTKTTF